MLIELGEQGAACYDVCLANKMNCDSVINTQNSSDIFQKLGIQCQKDNRPWWAENQPGFVSDRNDPNYGKCLGYIDVPSSVSCSGSYPTVRFRLPKVILMN